MFDRKYTSNVYSKTSLEYSMYKCLEFIGRAKLKNMGKRMKNKVKNRHFCGKLLNDFLSCNDV